MLFPGTPTLTSWLGWNYGSGREIPVSSSHSFITLYPHSRCMRNKLQATMNTRHSIMVPLAFAFSIQPQEFLARVAQLQHGSWRECPAKKSEHCLRCSESEVFTPEGNLVPRLMAPAQEHCCPTSLPFQRKQWAQLRPFKGLKATTPEDQPILMGLREAHAHGFVSALAMRQGFRNTPAEEKTQMIMTMSSLERFRPSANRYKTWPYPESMLKISRCLFSCLFPHFLALWFPENWNSAVQAAEKLRVTLHSSPVE